MVDADGRDFDTCYRDSTRMLIEQKGFKPERVGIGCQDVLHISVGALFAEESLCKSDDIGKISFADGAKQRERFGSRGEIARLHKGGQVDAVVDVQVGYGNELQIFDFCAALSETQKTSASRIDQYPCFTVDPDEIAARCTVADLRTAGAENLQGDVLRKSEEREEKQKEQWHSIPSKSLQ